MSWFLFLFFPWKKDFLHSITFRNIYFKKWLLISIHSFRDSISNTSNFFVPPIQLLFIFWVNIFPHSGLWSISPSYSCILEPLFGSFNSTNNQIGEDETLLCVRTLFPPFPRKISPFLIHCIFFFPVSPSSIADLHFLKFLRSLSLEAQLSLE